MPTRILLLIIHAALLGFFCNILVIGHNFNKDGPLKGCRKYIVSFLYRFSGTIFIAIAGVFTKK